MDLKVKSLENAVQAAKDLGLESVPWAWIKYIQSGWELENWSCSCVANWSWMKPCPFGAFARYGCVADVPLDISRLVETKRNESGVMKAKLAELKPNKEDVGKIFYTNLTGDEMAINTREELFEISQVEVGFWFEIGELDTHEFNNP